MQLQLERSDLAARLKSMEEALTDSKARERKALDDMRALEEQHAQEVLELRQGGAKAVRELLAAHEETKRAKVYCLSKRMCAVCP
jgi:hypothetical protein